MVALIRMGREFGYAKLDSCRRSRRSIWAATDVAAIRHLLMTDRVAARTVGEPIEIGALAAYERPLPTMIEYNQLLAVQIAVQA